MKFIILSGLIQQIGSAINDLITFDFIRASFQSFENQGFFRILWKRIDIVGILIVIALCFLPYPEFGRQILDEYYDIIIKKDFEKSAVAREEESPVSDQICMAVFDKNSYESPPGKDFWTPRDLLGKTIFKGIELGAKIVIADIELNTPVPLADENEAFLLFLEKAVFLARQKPAVILLPKITRNQNPCEYERRFYHLLDNSGDVIKEGITALLQNPSDNKVRHLVPYKLYGSDISFSLSVMAAVYHWHGIEKGDKILSDVKSRLQNSETIKEEIRIPSGCGVNPIRLFKPDNSGEYAGNRYRFRILPWETVRENYQHAEDLTFDMLKTVKQILDFNPKEKIYKEKILIIGSVNERLGDIHFTPVGKMPGVFLIANGVNLFLKGDQIHEISEIILILTEMILITAVAHIFLYLPSALAALILSLIFFIPYVHLSTWLLTQADIYLNFWRLIAVTAFLGFFATWKEVIDWFQQKKEELK